MFVKMIGRNIKYYTYTIVHIHDAWDILLKTLWFGGPKACREVLDALVLPLTVCEQLWKLMVTVLNRLNDGWGHKSNNSGRKRHRVQRTQ